jgi:MscS family membrane protein
VLNILGYIIELPAELAFLSTPGFAFAFNMLAWIIIAVLINLIFLRILKFITRRLPGDLEDIIFVILRRPILILFGLYGIDFSLRQLPLLAVVQGWIDTVSNTVVILVVTQIIGRFIKDIVVYYGEKWAVKTETKVDDVLIPILNLFGPLLLGLIAAMMILPLWGVNITSVLLGAGVLGLVLGLALQETLGNIFSGLSLLVESPFRKGDLIQLSDGRISEILHLGMRSTTMFSLEEHATIYVPNKMLAATILNNLTKPTPEQRFCIAINVSKSIDLAEIQNTLVKIADGHPALLSSNIPLKLEHVKELVGHIRQQANKIPSPSVVRDIMLAEADKNEQSIGKLALEGQFNSQILMVKEALRNLIRGINTREVQGLTEGERQELYCNFISPAEMNVQNTLSSSRAWLEAVDPWLNDTDHWQQRKLWESRNEQLLLNWERLKKNLYAVDDRNEMRLDDTTKVLIVWLEKEYKVPPGYWKDPTITIKDLDSDSIHLQLCYYLDNIRLEHDSRPHRVQTELNRIIHETMKDIGVWK